VVDALKDTFHGRPDGLRGPVMFNEIGDNPNAIPAMIQILGQKPVVVWPKDSPPRSSFFPRPSVDRRRARPERR